MSDTEKWFDRIIEDVERARYHFKEGNIDAVHYWLGRTIGGVRVVRSLMEKKPCESDESSKD